MDRKVQIDWWVGFVEARATIEDQEGERFLRAWEDEFIRYVKTI